MVEISAAGLMAINMVIMIFAVMIIFAIGYKTVPPNKVMVFKRRQHPEGFAYQFISGGGRFIPLVGRKPEVLSLNANLVRLELSDLRTKHNGENRKAFVDASAVYKISSSAEDLKLASENLSGKTDQEIAEVVRSKMEAGLRRLFSEKNFEEIAPDRDTLAGHISWIGSLDLNPVGLQLRSFHCHDIRLRG